MTKQSDKRRAWKELEEIDPDVIVLAFPCSPWPRLRLMERGERRVLLEKERDQHRALLKFTTDVAKYYNRKGRFVIVENPRGSDAWKQQELEWIVRNLHKISLDMCAFNLRHPKRTS